MYQIQKNTLGETLKEYRKINNMTLQDVGDKVCKSKGTIFKYETNEILPDFYTLLELCNLFNISINDLCEKTKEEDQDMINPFGKEKLYLYYYSSNKLIGSVIKIEKNMSKYNVRFFNGFQNEKNKYSDYYEGEMIADKSITYFDLNLNNKNLNNKVQIIVNIPWMFDNEIYNGLYTGITRNGFPVVKKVLVSKKEIKNFDKYNVQLKFSKEEGKSLYKQNALIFRNLEDFEIL